MTHTRIANFLPHYPQPSGTTTAVRGLSRGLARLGWDIVIYCCPEEGLPLNGDAADDGIQTVRFEPCGRNPFHVDRHLLARLSQNKDKIDLLILNGMFCPSNLSLAAASRRAGIPYVVCPHDPYQPSLLKKGRLRKLLYGSFYERPFLNAASAIQVLAEEHKKLLSNYGVHRPVLVIPNGFDPREIADSEERGQQARLDGNNPKFLYLGRLDMHNKGLDLLLIATALGIRQGKLPPTLRLDFVGADWGDQAKLELLASQLRITENIRFLGRITDRSSWAIIASYDVLVLPSRWDGFGLVGLEAMVAAKPLIVSTEAGISSYVDQAECGYLVKPEAASICAGLTLAIQTRDQWQTMGRRGKEFAYKHLTWEMSAERASLCYEELLHNVRASG